ERERGGTRRGPGSSGAGGDDPTAVGAEGAVEDRPPVGAKELQHAPGRDVPEASIVIPARGDEERSVRAEPNRRESVLVASQNPNERSGSSVPEPCSPVSAGGRDRPRGGAEGRRGGGRGRVAR